MNGLLILALILIIAPRLSAWLLALILIAAAASL